MLNTTRAPKLPAPLLLAEIQGLPEGRNLIAFAPDLPRLVQQLHDALDKYYARERLYERT